ncbi:hypothetical protein [Winogradskya humida]|uniref:hypothetical protein n=1 Tax=Winogradskya humida TaxID=113566 RepID=UPI0019447482|nr:hypothetical protein [Actinoplanes humidus]
MTAVVGFFHHDVWREFGHDFRIAGNAGRDDRIEANVELIVGKLGDGRRHLHGNGVSAFSAMWRVEFDTGRIVPRRAGAGTLDCDPSFTHFR